MNQNWIEASPQNLKDVLYYSSNIVLQQKFLEDINDAMAEAKTQYQLINHSRIIDVVYHYSTEKSGMTHRHIFRISGRDEQNVLSPLVHIKFSTSGFDGKYDEGSFEIIDEVETLISLSDDSSDSEDNGMGAFIARNRSSDQTLTDKEISELYDSIKLLRTHHDARKYHRLRILKTVLESMTTDQKLTRRRNTNTCTVYSLMEGSEEVAKISIND